MDIKKLIEERKALLEEAAKPETTAERFGEIRSRVEKIDFLIENAESPKTPATPSEEELRGARLPNGGAEYRGGKDPDSHHAPVSECTDGKKRHAGYSQ